MKEKKSKAQRRKYDAGFKQQVLQIDFKRAIGKRSGRIPGHRREPGLSVAEPADLKERYRFFQQHTELWLVQVF